MKMIDEVYFIEATNDSGRYLTLFCGTQEGRPFNREQATRHFHELAAIRNDPEVTHAPGSKLRLISFRRFLTMAAVSLEGEKQVIAERSLAS